MSKKRHNDDKHVGPLLWAVYICAVIALLTVFLQSPVPGFRMTFFKALGFQAAVTAMFGAWLALAVVDRRYRPRKSAIVTTVVIFSVVLLASLTFAVDPQLSFWSSERRMTGIAFTLHCTAWFLVLSSVMRSREEWRPFLGVMSAVSTVMAAIGIGQSIAHPLTEPAIGALGNPSYLAAYLLVSAFITGYLLVGSRGRMRLLLGVSFAAQVVAAVLTASRGAIVTLVACLVLGAIGFALVSGMMRRRKLLAAGGSLFVVALLAAAFFWSQSPSGHDWIAEAELPYFIKRVALKNFGGDRLVLWDIAIKGIAERPGFGYGGEQFETVFGAHYDPYGPGREVFYERWFDKAHNQYLDTLVAFGAAGLAAFAAVWFAVTAGFFGAFRRAENRTERRQLMMLILASVGYLSYNAFIFDTTSQLIVLYALLAFLTVALPEFAGRSPEEIPAPESRKAAVRSKYILIAVAPVLLAAVWFADVRPYVMAGRLYEANELMKTDRSAAVEAIPEALAGFNPYVHDFRLKSISGIIPFAESVHVVSPQMEELLTMLARESAETAEARPTNIRAQLAAAVMHRLLGEYDPARLVDAERYVSDAEAVAPGNHAVYQELAEIRLLQGDPDAALEQYEKSMGMVFEMQREHRGIIRYRMSCAYAMKRDFARMFESLEEANALGFRSQHDIRLAEALGETAESGDDLSAIYGYLDGNLKSYPDHPRLLISAAKIYGAAGDRKSAEDMIGRLRERDPAAADMLQGMVFPEDDEMGE